MNSKQTEEKDLKKAQDDWNRDRQDFLMNMPAESAAKPVSEVRATGAEKLIESAQEACMLIIGAYEGYSWEGGDLQRTASDMFEYAKAGYEVSKAKPVSGDVQEMALKHANENCKDADTGHNDMNVFYHRFEAFKSGYAAAPAKDERIEQLESGIINFLNWLTYKRPDIAGAGAPISILRGLINGVDFILPKSPSDSEAGDGWIWTDTLACEWAGYLESKLKYSSVQHIPQLLSQWKQSKFPAPPIQKTVK